MFAYDFAYFGGKHYYKHGYSPQGKQNPLKKKSFKDTLGEADSKKMAPAKATTSKKVSSKPKTIYDRFMVFRVNADPSFKHYQPIMEVSLK